MVAGAYRVRVRVRHRFAPRPLLIRALLLAVAAPVLIGAAAATAAGPPYPDPVVDQAVYDTAEAFRSATIRQVEATIDGIENRTGAEIVVYTQLVPYGISTEQAEQDAIALMDQWGVGRKGIDDGLVILFDLHRGDACHGQVQLYAGPGYRATYLSNSERQAIFENDMLPLLRQCDLDGAVLVALAKVDANATPEHAGTLSFFRQLNAVLGLLVAPLLALLVIAWGLMNWLRFGRDPVYLDDPSIHIPAAPRGLTPAAGAVMRDGRATRRALTAASLDLASRGLIAFRPEMSGLLVKKTEVGIEIGPAGSRDSAEQARAARARSRPTDAATEFLDERLRSLGGDDRRIEPDDMLKLGAYVTRFDKLLEAHVVAQGWFREDPVKATNRWMIRGFVALGVGLVSVFAGAGLPSDGLLLIGVGQVIAGGMLIGLARSMPARTMPGAMIRAMLEAYRRTLQKTMAQARSMGEVVAATAIPLIESPDDVVVWGVALGLQEDVEDVLGRTADDMEHARSTGGYMPLWYGSGDSEVGGTDASGGWAPGLMSSSPIPNFSGMMAALGTIGNSPSSSGSGGGFSGGSSGGGGGGSGGGF